MGRAVDTKTSDDGRQAAGRDVRNPAGANARSVWTIPTEPTPFAHFATWPQKLVARMIQAGTIGTRTVPANAGSRGCGNVKSDDAYRQTPPRQLSTASDTRGQHSGRLMVITARAIWPGA